MLSTEVILRRCGPYLSYTCRVCLNFQPERGPGNCCSCSCRCGCCYYYCYVLLLNLSTHPMPTLHHRNSATAQTATAYKTLFNQRFQHLPPELNTTRRAYLKTQRPPTHQPVVVPVARSSNHPPRERNVQMTCTFFLQNSVTPRAGRSPHKRHKSKGHKALVESDRTSRPAAFRAKNPTLN